jgi:hypothetical protein
VVRLVGAQHRSVRHQGEVYPVYSSPLVIQTVSYTGRSVM